MHSVKKVFKYFWSFIKPFKVAYFSVFFALTLRIAFGTLATGYIYKILIDVLNDSTNFISDRYSLAILILIPLSLSFFLAFALGRYAEWVYDRFMAKILKNMYDFSFEKLALHSHGFYSNNFTGSLVAKTKRFVNASNQLANIFMFNFWPTIVLVTGSVLALYFQSAKLAIYFFVWCFFYSVIIFFFVKQKMKLDLARAEADSKITGALSDSITNMSNIKAFSAFKKEFGYFKGVTSFFQENTQRAWKFNTGRHAFQAFTMFIFEVFVVYSAVGLWKNGEITVGVFVMVYAYLHTITGRIWDLSSGLTKFMESVSDGKEMVDILETEIEVKDPKEPEELKIKSGEIEFNNISFGYINDNGVFEDFYLKIRPGERVGLVGHSGSGKSSLIKLLLRLVDVKKGVIRIDGQDIRNITQDDLRSVISYVPQESILFHRSIKDNIGYSKENATDREIEEAAKKAHAHEFISSLVNGYDTMVGERGVKLSGGERQRVSIARDMLKNAPILVLDEATSSLDSISESYIQDAFNELMKNKTTIVIAHRLSTVQKMDRIVVLDKGKIVEEGSHVDLLEKSGFYKSLWDYQTGVFLE